MQMMIYARLRISSCWYDCWALHNCVSQYFTYADKVFPKVENICKEQKYLKIDREQYLKLAQYLDYEENGTYFLLQ